MELSHENGSQNCLATFYRPVRMPRLLITFTSVGHHPVRCLRRGNVSYIRSLPMTVLRFEDCHFSKKDVHLGVYLESGNSPPISASYCQPRSVCTPSEVRGLHSFIGAYEILARAFPTKLRLFTRSLDDATAGLTSQQPRMVCLIDRRSPRHVQSG